MNTCRYFQPRLALWAGGDLNPSEAAALQSHLAICPTCGDYLARMQQAVMTLERADPEPTYLEQPRSLWPEVSRKIAAAAAIPHVPIYRRKWVLGVAVSCLLVFVSWIVWPREPAGPARLDPRGATHPGILTVPEEAEENSTSPMSHSRSLLE